MLRGMTPNLLKKYCINDLLNLLAADLVVVARIWNFTDCLADHLQLKALMLLVGIGRLYLVDES